MCKAGGYRRGILLWGKAAKNKGNKLMEHSHMPESQSVSCKKKARVTGGGSVR